jgi:hypothetical protein
MFTIIIYIALAILVGVYANSKGRSGFGFFFFAALLSPLIGLLSPLIGFVIALVISPISSKVEQNALDVGDMKKCPSCAELVKTEATLCKHCRTELACSNHMTPTTADRSDQPIKEFQFFDTPPRIKSVRRQKTTEERPISKIHRE